MTKSNRITVAHFYLNGKLVQKIASHNQKKLENLRSRFYKGTLKFTESPETRPNYYNKLV